MVQWKMPAFEKVTTIGDTPIFRFHDYGRKGKINKISSQLFKDYLRSLTLLHNMTWICLFDA